jgi:hypothetical protein
MKKKKSIFYNKANSICGKRCQIYLYTLKKRFCLGCFITKRDTKTMPMKQL